LAAELVALTADLDTLQIPATMKPSLNKEIEGLVGNKIGEQKDLAKIALLRAEAIAKELTENKKNLVVEEIDTGADRKILSKALEAIRDKCPETAIMLFTKTDKQIFIMSYVGPSLTSVLSASDWAKDVALVCGGKGGGKADTAQASGDQVAKFEECMQKAVSYTSEKLSKK